MMYWFKEGQMDHWDKLKCRNRSVFTCGFDAWYKWLFKLMGKNNSDSINSIRITEYSYRNTPQCIWKQISDKYLYCSMCTLYPYAAI